MTKRRRLDLLPEILPKPTTVAGPSSVRARALARLSVLAALQAASSGCGGSSSSEEGPYGVVDPLPWPSGGTRERDRTPSTTGTGNASGVMDPFPDREACYTLGIPEASARYVDDAVTGGRDAGTTAVDAGLSDAGQSDASPSDAGSERADAGSARRVEVHLELLFLSPPTALGQAVPRTAGVTVVAASVAGLRATLVLSIPAASAVRLDLPVVCQRQSYEFRIELELQPSSVDVRVTSG